MNVEIKFTIPIVPSKSALDLMACNSIIHGMIPLWNHSMYVTFIYISMFLDIIDLIQVS